ncbi:hypothetical protein [Streptococcus suis]|uniref:hypothetical protein n=1 Tax=Streptococcus suis TaxID=1307 RepID=UPI00209AFD25|nr:hypothetical protein [Streptococcus suis]
MLYFLHSSSTLTWSMSRLAVHSCSCYRPIQIIRSFKTEEEKRYFIIQAIFALFAMTLTYSVGIWLGHVKPHILILPAGLALAILYRLYFKKEKTDER